MPIENTSMEDCRMMSDFILNRLASHSTRQIQSHSVAHEFIARIIAHHDELSLIEIMNITRSMNIEGRTSILDEMEVASVLLTHQFITCDNHTMKICVDPMLMLTSRSLIQSKCYGEGDK